ncbi:MAG: helix-turn-helix domain-containing protein [Chloroflexota bacterium]|nr:helix-turn-helix domain-containing protein [Chloroflexota bacterium]MDE2948882.1 helix-turn-helix domain-containing protein [Chloroflexota bacterium]
MIKCPHCQDTEQQVKAGFNRSGSQLHKYKPCNRRYTPVPSEKGHPQHIRQQALRLYMEGNNFRRIARLLQVSHVSVMNWVKAHADQLPAPPTPAEKPLHIIEMDELHTFVGHKKTDGT